MTRRTVSSLVVAIAVAAASLVHLLQAESAAPAAQQRAQTDLQFARERARVTAVDGRIAALRQRLAGLERAGSVRASAQPAERRGERRVPQTLTHRDRLVSAAEAENLTRRLDSAAQQARTLGERVNRPDFGAGLSALEQELERLEAAISGYE